MRYTAPRAVTADGRWILYVVSHGQEKGTDVVEWRLIHPDGSGMKKVHLADGFDPTGFDRENHLWGRLSRSGKAEIAIYGLGAPSKPIREIPIPGSIRSLSLSPDGSRFAALADPEPPDPLAGVHTVVQPERSSLYVVDADGSGGSWWRPELRDVASAVWAPDSKRIALASAVPKIGNYEMKSEIDVTDGNGLQSVVKLNNVIGDVAWSSRGTELLFLSTTNSVLTVDHLFSVPVTGGQPTDLTPEMVGTVFGIESDSKGGHWVLTGRSVWSEIDRRIDDEWAGQYELRDGLLGGLPVLCHLDGAVVQPVFGMADPQHCMQLAIQKGRDFVRITHDGDRELANVRLGEVQTIDWSSKEGVDLEGIVTFPPDFKKGTRYPLVVIPHGGPEANDTLQLDNDAQFLAGLGYVVIKPEYRGSTGFGADFLQAIYRHFGDRAYRDVDSAADYAIEQGWADPNRLAMFGWSAGGFMTSWTITQTDRYKAAIEGAGITDWGSFMWTSDIQQFDYDGRWPDRDPEAFERFSPVMFADRVKTPLLILHGEADARVPTYLGREYFEELLAKGKTVRMVTYPGSGHFPSKWEQRADVYRELAAWLKKYDP